MQTMPKPPTAADFVKVHKHPPRVGSLVVSDDVIYRWDGRQFELIAPVDEGEAVDSVCVQITDGIAIRAPVESALSTLLRCMTGVGAEVAQATVATFCDALRESGWRDAIGVSEIASSGTIQLSTLHDNQPGYRVQESYHVEDLSPIAEQLMQLGPRLFFQTSSGTLVSPLLSAYATITLVRDEPEDEEQTCQPSS